MTFGKFFGFAFLLWLFLAAVKVFFVKMLGLDGGFTEYAYWFFIAIFSIALSRRLGHINFLEAMLVAGFWFLISLVLDFLVTSPLAGSLILSRWQVWVGYLVMALSIFFFHKKRHVHVREQQAAHHH